jgi:trans-2-enoyl-CoA reductase
VGVWNFQTCPTLKLEVVATALSGAREHELAQIITVMSAKVWANFIER